MTRKTAAPSRTPTLSELIRNSFDFYQEDIHTCLPGRVEKYDPGEQRADVQPMVQRRLVAEDGTELIEALPQIPEVPVAFPRSGEFFVSFPVKQGDLGILVFAERSMELYLEGEGRKQEGDDPADYRKHDLTDAFFIPGGYPWKRSIKEADPDNMVMGKDEGGLQIHVKPDGTMDIRVSGTADEVVALGNALKAFWDGTFTTWATGHTHPTGVGPSGPPTPGVPITFPALPTSILSTILNLKSG